MEFTFIRAERSQEENQERAFIAASRRTDRDYSQRIESLKKASALHYARTGRMFELSSSQVARSGPLTELPRDMGHKRQQTEQIETHSHGPPEERQERRFENVILDDSSQNYTRPSSQIFTQTTIQPTQLHYHSREQDTAVPEAETLLHQDIFYDSSGLEGDAHPTEFEDAFRASEYASFNTTQPERNGSIEEPLYLGEDILAHPFDPSAWGAFSTNIYNELMGFEDLRQFSSLPGTQPQVSPNLETPTDRARVFEETNSSQFSTATPHGVFFQHIEDAGNVEEDVEHCTGKDNDSIRNDP